jgi:hypothetical protein
MLITSGGHDMSFSDIVDAFTVAHENEIDYKVHP